MATIVNLFRQPKLLKSAGLLAILVVLAQVYSNCSSPYELLVQGSIMAANDKETMYRLENGSVWQIRLSSYDLSDSSAPVDSISSLAPATVGVANPGAGPSPSLVASSVLKKNVFQFQSGQTLQSGPLEVAMTAEKYTIVALVDASSTGNIFSINNGARGSEDLSLKIQSGAVVASHATNATSFMTLTQPIDAATSGPLIIAATFGIAADDISLQINGKLSTIAPVTTGTPADSAYVLRQLMIGDSAAGTSLQTGELDVFNTRLSPAQANTVSRSIATKWKTAPVEYIPYGTDDTAPPPDSPEFAALKPILHEHCAECHAPGYTYYFVGLSETDLANSKWVVKGNSAQSTLYTRLIGATATGDMPQNRTPLTVNQIAAFKAWIDSLK